VPYSRCHFEWSWVTLSDLAKCSMTRSTARPLCDSWASCHSYNCTTVLFLFLHSMTWPFWSRWTKLFVLFGARKKQRAGIVLNTLNPLDSKTIIVQHRIIRSWYTGRWWVGCYIWYSEEGPGRAAAAPSPLLAVPNVTAHLSTASVYQSLYCCMMVRCSAVLIWRLKG